MPKPSSRKRPGRAPKPRVSPGSVFLNIPYDAKFENLLLAYIAAISAFGFTPRATLEIPFGQRRLDRILDLITESQYSIHDLSRVQLDRVSPPTPRFNMPFELGLTIALEKTTHPTHAWIVCESKRRRLSKSLSDLDGTDPYIHDGRIVGVFREISNAFVASERRPSVTEMMQIYRVLRLKFDDVLRRAGAQNPFNARVFKELGVIARSAAAEIVGR